MAASRLSRGSPRMPAVHDSGSCGRVPGGWAVQRQGPMPARARRECGRGPGRTQPQRRGTPGAAWAKAPGRHDFASTVPHGWGQLVPSRELARLALASRAGLPRVLGAQPLPVAAGLAGVTAATWAVQLCPGAWLRSPVGGTGREQPQDQTLHGALQTRGCIRAVPGCITQLPPSGSSPCPGCGPAQAGRVAPSWHQWLGPVLDRGC